MNRRAFLLGAAGFTCSLSVPMLPAAAFAQGKGYLARTESISAWQRRIRSILDRGRLPIIDMEATYIEGTTNVSRMIEYMNEFDVAQIAFAPANAATSAPSLDLYRKYPEYFIPTTNSGEFPRSAIKGARFELNSASGNRDWSTNQPRIVYKEPGIGQIPPAAPPRREIPHETPNHHDHPRR